MSYVVQGTGAWFNQRCGKLTASRMKDAIACRKDGKPSADRTNLLKEILAERMTGNVVPHYNTPEMRHGTEQEPFAKAAYETETGSILRPGYFVDHPTIENFGATPDAFLGREAVVEFKCPKTTTHLDWVIDGTVPDQHKPQILAQLACTQRTRAVFVSFDPRINGPRQLFIREWTPEPAEIAAIESAARDFLAELERMWDALSVAA